ncbi:hypothetical protein PENSPDRAFT_586185 [Peniophora sp. CONT]|nr:hypothetical protein PENSPDRAFT_586185 [Peniophora sp. CONT]
MSSTFETVRVSHQFVAPDSPVKRRALEERWFGAFGDWLSRLNKVKQSSNTDLSMQKSFSSVLYSGSQNCASDDGTTEFSASLDITCSGSAAAHLAYGFYLEGQIFPPKINQAYVYASNDGSATLGFEISGKAGIQYDTSKVQIIPSITWPGLSYPGIVTIGPQLTIYGQLTGSLTLSGTFATQATYTIPSTSVNMGITGDSQAGNRDIAPTIFQVPQSWNINPTADVNLDGSLRVDVTPEAALVFNLLPGTPVSVAATAYVDLDGSMTLSFNADLNGVDAHVGTSVDINSGVSAGSSLFTFGPFNLYHAAWDLYNYHLDLGTTDSSRRRSLDSGLRRNLTAPTFSAQLHTFTKRGIFDGLLTCPEPSDQSASQASCAADFALEDPANADTDDTTSEVSRKRDFTPSVDSYRWDDQLDRGIEYHAFLSGKRVYRTLGNLNTMDPGNALFYVRAAALSVHYMNEPDIELKFKRVAEQIENLWIQFFIDYNRLTGNSAVTYDVQRDYRQWLNNDILGKFGARANEFVVNATAGVEAGLANGGGTLSTHAPKACSATAVNFDEDDWEDLLDEFPDGIAWLYP